MSKTIEKPKSCHMFVAGKAALNGAIASAARFVAARPTHPVIGNILITWDAATGAITATGTNLRQWGRFDVVGDVAESGSVAVPAKLFGDIVGKLPSDCDVSLAMDGCNVTLSTAVGTYHIAGMSDEDFPLMPTVDDAVEVNFYPGDLRAGLAVAAIASGDETKQVLCGVNLRCDGTTATFAATDGHRLAVSKSEMTTAIAEPLEVTLPSRFAVELMRVLAAIPKEQQDEPISLEIAPHRVAFNADEATITCAVLDGQYPNYSQLIPTQFSRQMTCLRRNLISSLERVAVIADQKGNHIVKFQLRPLDSVSATTTGSLTVSVEAQDVGAGNESLDAQIQGGDLDIAFNVKYLLESLKAIESTEVVLNLDTPTSPVIITPLGGQLVKHLIMPVQIRS